LKKRGRDRSRKRKKRKTHQLKLIEVLFTTHAHTLTHRYVQEEKEDER
jgi:hypothetical protein